MANSKRDAGREAFWRRTLKRQAASGLSVRAFCRRETLAESNFYAWRRTIAERDREGNAKRVGSTKRAKTAPAFVPVTIQDVSPRHTGVVVELGSGRRLLLSEAIEPQRLAAIVHALEVEAVS